MSNFYIKPLPPESEMTGAERDAAFLMATESPLNKLVFGSFGSDLRHDSFLKVIWEASGLVSLEKWLGVSNEKLRKGTIVTGQCLPRVSAGGAKALVVPRDTYIETIKEADCFGAFQEYEKFSPVDPINQWHDFLLDVIHEFHRHPDWYIYLD